ncbi:hypothetical protein G7Y79_00007g022150 [Physcia stellaris]|nr:hypothetical protein G7Y79_00007g022150 [Physcia stellaris]
MSSEPPPPRIECRPSLEMADDTVESDDERAIELSTLAAIYPELVLDPDNAFKASILIPVEPIEPLAVLFPAGPEPEMTVQQDTHLLSYLPPLQLSITLPSGYPTEEPPVFHIEASPPWLPEGKLQVLREAGHIMWEEMGRDQVVYAYMDHLREAAEDAFGLMSEKEHLEVPQDLKFALLDFNSKAERAKFEAGTFECIVCIEMKKGIDCHRLLSCGHVFCVECLQDCFNLCITEGDVGSVKCMASKCDENSSKHDRTLDPSELLQIPLSHDQVQRYIKLKRKKKYEADPTTIYCPRSWCQGPARTNDSSKSVESTNPNEPPPPRKILDLEDRSTIPDIADRLAVCIDCSFAFCMICKASWHGEYYSCVPRLSKELNAEEKASEEYMKLHSTPCPTCLARCQKSMGCNHMRCSKCEAHFCYLCSAWLDPANPYLHFNTAKTPCYSRLWELEAGDGADVGINFGGGVDDAGGFAGIDDHDDDQFDLNEIDDDEEDSDDEGVTDDEDELREVARRRAPAPRVAVPVRARNGQAGNGRARGARN